MPSMPKKVWPEIVKKYKIDDAKIDPMVTMTANENWMEYIEQAIVNNIELGGENNDY